MKEEKGKIGSRSQEKICKKEREREQPEGQESEEDKENDDDENDHRDHDGDQDDPKRTTTERMRRTTSGSRQTERTNALFPVFSAALPLQALHEDKTKN